MRRPNFIYGISNKKGSRKWQERGKLQGEVVGRTKNGERVLINSYKHFSKSNFARERKTPSRSGRPDNGRRLNGEG